MPTSALLPLPEAAEVSSAGRPRPGGRIPTLPRPAPPAPRPGGLAGDYAGLAAFWESRLG